MRALSLWQPWAELVVSGRKTIETRCWQHLPLAIIGQRLAIHAARHRDHGTDADSVQFGYDPHILTYGAVIGHVMVTAVRWLTLDDTEAACCPCAGKCGIIMSDPVNLVRPWPTVGFRRFWDVPYSRMLDLSVRSPQSASFAPPRFEAQSADGENS